MPPRRIDGVDPMFDWIMGTRRPVTGTPAASAGAVRTAILAVARPTAPFVVRPATPDDGGDVDLLAEWRLADPAWYAVFAPVRVKQFRIFMRLDAEQHEVRALDRLFDVQWTAGRPTIAVQATRGQVCEVEFGVPPFVETTADGQRIRFRFATAELKNPLRDAVRAQGWTWRGAMSL